MPVGVSLYPIHLYSQHCLLNPVVQGGTVVRAEHSQNLSTGQLVCKAWLGPECPLRPTVFAVQVPCGAVSKV